MHQNIPMNIWVIKESQFEQFTYTCGKVIFIAEEIDEKYRNHPAIISAGSLLPPIEAIQAELDGNYELAETLYCRYLASPEADPYVSIIIAAAIKKIPIGIMFGKDELNQKFPVTFINYLFNVYGLVLGVMNEVMPCIIYEAMPAILAKLYMMNIIDYPTFMMLHPDDMPINPMVISRLAFDTRPLVEDANESSYIEYFNTAIKEMKNRGKYLIDPFDKCGL